MCLPPMSREHPMQQTAMREVPEKLVCVSQHQDQAQRTL